MYTGMRTMRISILWTNISLLLLRRSPTGGGCLTIKRKMGSWNQEGSEFEGI